MAKRRKYCSRPCHDAARRLPGETRICEAQFCDNPISPLRRGAYRNEQRFCCKTCRMRSERPGAKIAPGDVRQIRRRARNGESQTKIAARYGVSQPAISSILRGKTWVGVG